MALSTDADFRDAVQRLGARVSTAEAAVLESKKMAALAESRFSQVNSDLAMLTMDLRAFTQQIARLSLMTESRNRVHILDSQLEQRYGGHAAVRRFAAELLQAAGGPLWNDVAAGAAGVMPGLAREYWLASAGLAFVAWVNGDRSEAERRVGESLLADNAAASLYFALVAHRFGRSGAAVRWFERYFAALDARALSLEAIQVFLAACDGVFGAEVGRALVSAAREWVAADRAAREGEPMDLEPWLKVLQSKATPAAAGTFLLLREHCGQWAAIAENLEWVGLQTSLAAFYRGLIGGEGAAAKGAPIHYDSPRPEVLLADCMQAYLEDEKPLRRDRALSLILLEENGDLDAAGARMHRDWSERGEKRGFSTLLAAMVGGDIVVPEWTEKLAFGLSFPWIDMAYDEIRKQAVRGVPPSLELKIGDWIGQTVGGENESDLLASFSRSLNEEQTGRSGQLQLQWLDEKLILPGVLLLAVTLLTVNTIIIPLCAMGGFGYYFYLRMQAADKEKAVRAEESEKKRREGIALVTSCLEEVKAYRRKLLEKNREMDSLREQMRGIDFLAAGGMTLPKPEVPAADVRQATLPIWDLEPPLS